MTAIDDLCSSLTHTITDKVIHFMSTRNIMIVDMDTSITTICNKYKHIPNLQNLLSNKDIIYTIMNVLKDRLLLVVSSKYNSVLLHFSYIYGSYSNYCARYQTKSDKEAEVHRYMEKYHIRLKLNKYLFLLFK